MNFLFERWKLFKQQNRATLTSSTNGLGVPDELIDEGSLLTMLCSRLPSVSGLVSLISLATGTRVPSPGK